MPPIKTQKSYKTDQTLADARDLARAAIVEITTENTIGEHRDYLQESERTGTHHFATNLAGYRGWVWFATVTRVSRSKVVTVSEVGLLPSDGALIAPDWVPWSQRVRPEDLESANGIDTAGSSAGLAEAASATADADSAPVSASIDDDASADGADDDVEDIEDIEDFKAAKRNPRRRRRR